MSALYFVRARNEFYFTERVNDFPGREEELGKSKGKSPVIHDCLSNGVT